MWVSVHSIYIGKKRPYFFQQYANTICKGAFMTIGTLPELINAIAILVMVVFVINVLIKLGKLIDKYREEINRK